MKRKEVLEVLNKNQGKALYLKYGDSSTIMLHCQTSKTALLKASRFIHAFRESTYFEERPDLKGKVTDGDRQIVTFDATSKSGKTIEQVLRGA